jgi:hypothetical protein
VVAVAKGMEERDKFLVDIRYRLEQAQQVQKKHYDKLHRHVTYQVGDSALLQLCHRAALSISQASTGKLKPCYFELINDVVICLALPPRARLHDVFHIGFPRKFRGPPPDASPPLPTIHHGASVPKPNWVVKSRLAHRVRQVLVKWKGEYVASATWEDVVDFTVKHPTF